MKGETLTFKIASEQWEYEQIHQLNYRTFVEEIPQHEKNSRKLLIDKFNSENTYFICLRDTKVLGMVAVREKRPFSLDRKLENLTSYLPPHHSICEIRLLAVEGDFRGGRVFQGLMNKLIQYCLGVGYDLAIISGTVRQLKLYKHLGFVPFGPLVGTSEALYQPMYLTKEGFTKQSKLLKNLLEFNAPKRVEVNLLPGPVSIHQRVQSVFSETPVSHRSAKFKKDFKSIKEILCQLTNTKNVEILLGSGTLANDAVAAQLALNPEYGLILSNGEFGDRLVDHATRVGLKFHVHNMPWGEPFDYNEVKEKIAQNPEIKWLWAVHCETSTGVLNDLARLKELCSEREIKLCLDCISSIGAVPLDLAAIYLATGVSGKALGAFPGLSMVFYNHEILPDRRLPRYLDLGLFAEGNGIAFTHSSNLVYALQAALERFKSENIFTETIDLAVWLRSRLAEKGFEIVAPEAHGAPHVFTLVLPLDSASIGKLLEEDGFLVSYNSSYLLSRNWIQICLMGECSKETLEQLMDLLEKYCTVKDLFIS